MSPEQVSPEQAIPPKLIDQAIRADMENAADDWLEHEAECDECEVMGNVRRSCPVGEKIILRMIFDSLTLRERIGET